MFFKHHGLDESVPLHFESSGTKRLFHLLPQLGFALNRGIPCCPRRDRRRSSRGYRRRSSQLVPLPRDQSQRCATLRYLSQRRSARRLGERGGLYRREGRQRRDSRYTAPRTCAAFAVTPVSIPSTARGCSAVSRKSDERRCSPTGRGRSNSGESSLSGSRERADRAFARFLQLCCDGEGLHLHLNVTTGSGGDSVSVVREAALRLTRKSRQEGYQSQSGIAGRGSPCRKT